MDERWKEHQYRRNERNSHLYQAFRKYGIENFKIESIDESATTKDELFALEKYYIKLYNSNNKEVGYNMTEGGDGVSPIQLDENQIVKLYKEGKSSEEIAKLLGVSSNTILRRLKKNNISPNWNVDEEFVRYIIDQYLIPRTVNDLVQETGKSNSAINYIIRTHGIKRHGFRESHENIHDIYSDYVSGSLTNEQICKKYSIHKSTLYKLIDYYKETYLN